MHFRESDALTLSAPGDPRAFACFGARVEPFVGGRAKDFESSGAFGRRPRPSNTNAVALGSGVPGFAHFFDHLHRWALHAQHKF